MKTREKKGLTEDLIKTLLKKLEPDELSESIVGSCAWSDMDLPDKMVSAFGVLLLRSEDRYQNVAKSVMTQNEIIQQANARIANIIDKYESHIKGLSAQRDLLQNENIKLREENSRIQQEKDKLHEQFYHMVDRMVSMHGHTSKHTDNNINIHP